MKLFVHTDSERKYLDETTQTREELVNAIGSEWVEIDEMNYSISDVFAEEDVSRYNIIIWILIGAFIGFLIKPIGAIGGGIIGAIIGGEINRKESLSVEVFNESVLLRS